MSDVPDADREAVARAFCEAEGLNPDCPTWHTKRPRWVLYGDAADAAIGALRERGWQRVPKGWKLSPVRPTSAMEIAGINSMQTGAAYRSPTSVCADIGLVYEHMLSAAPSSPGDEP